MNGIEVDYDVPVPAGREPAPESAKTATVEVAYSGGDDEFLAAMDHADREPVGAPEKLGLKKSIWDDGLEATERQKKAHDALRALFIVSEGQYHFKNAPNPKESLAFVDKGNKLTTKHENPEMIRSMIVLAEAKGWSDIKVKGSEDFKREAWIEAAARGFKVVGHVPSEVDKERMRERRDDLAINQIEPVEEKKGRGAAATAAITEKDIEKYANSDEFRKTHDALQRMFTSLGVQGDGVKDYLLKSYAKGEKVELSQDLQRETYQEPDFKKLATAIRVPKDRSR
ncbi:MAG: hypothetical protein LBI87_01995 [Candidatus Accumulibacter sp.]|jgi:hypothetical protein|nr:hypothetical protein [Accumulibacter sp.]